MSNLTRAFSDAEPIPDQEQKKAALGYVHEAWAEARLDGIEDDCMAQACLFALLYGLTPDERWDARHNPGAPVRATGWGPVLGVIAALMVGATALMATIAFGGQRYFEWQVEEARRISA